MVKRSISLSFVLVFLAFFSKADSGYNLWLNYKTLPETDVKACYRAHLGSTYFPEGSAKLKVAADEIRRGIAGMLSITPKEVAFSQARLIVVKVNELGDPEGAQLCNPNSLPVPPFRIKMSGRRHIVHSVLQVLELCRQNRPWAPAENAQDLVRRLE